MIEPGEFMYLGACPSCGGLWFCAAYEPYAAFSYLVSWGRSPSDWRRLYRRDHGQSLARWQAARIRALYAQLGDEDRQIIARHQQRSFGRSPLDPETLPGEGAPDLAALLSEPEDRD